MTLLGIMTLIGSLTLADKPCQPSVPLDECVRQVDTLWRGGDAVAAGTAAELLLERAPREEEAFVNDGARIAFIAAIGRYAAQSQPAAEYWLWVAARHESECGQRLPPPYRQIVDMHGAVPGGSRVRDRLLIRSPFLTSPSGCVDLNAAQIDLSAVPAPGAPAALVFFEGRDHRLASSDRQSVPAILYEYPTGALPASWQDNWRVSRRDLRRALQERVFVLDPCMPPFLVGGATLELCRADTAQTEAE